MDRRYYTTSQAADLLAVSSDTVLKWVRQGKISSYRTPGGHARIPREAVERLLPVQINGQSLPSAEPPAYHYCWEFYAPEGRTKPECHDCMVFRSRARRCYELREISEEFGYLTPHCHSECEDCEYYGIVRDEGTQVLIVTRNSKLRDSLTEEAEGGDVVMQFADSEYQCASILHAFRPDYVVLDCALGRNRTQEMCRYLSTDERIPFTKIILTSRSADVEDCFDGRIFGWIKKPFTFQQLRCCLGQAE